MHKPVLLNEVLEIFDPQPGQIYIDATINGGGHARAILERTGPEGKLLGIDWDCDLIQELRTKNLELRKPNLILVCDNYARIKSIAREYNLGKVSGILFDLGFSSYHLEESQRGFSFLRNEPLDMRYSPKTNALTAAQILNQWPRQTIENILREFGEERFAGRIAAGIIRARAKEKIAGTVELVEIITRSVPARYRRSKIHFATRTFQALRIVVNSELENLEIGLGDAIELLAPQGKIIAISFHSLEDRIVKRFFLEKEKEKVLGWITSKPVLPTIKEIENNPRSRSAKLRAARKL